MKVALFTDKPVNGSDVRDVARQNGLNVVQARVMRVSGGPERLAVEFDHSNETKPKRSDLVALAGRYGVALRRSNVAVTPQWAAAATPR